MARSNNPSKAQVSLQFKDHEELLDITDHLRGESMSRYIDRSSSCVGINSLGKAQSSKRSLASDFLPKIIYALASLLS